MSGTMTLQQALDEVNAARVAGQTISETRFQEIVQSLSVDGAPGQTTTVFYSGSYVEEIQSFEAAGQLAIQSSDIRIIDKTDVGLFLSDDIVQQEIARSVTGSTNTQNPTFKSFYNGGADSLWGQASRNFAAATIGDVITLTPFSESTSIWASVEFETLLTESGATHINGISVLELNNQLGSNPNTFSQALTETRYLVDLQAQNGLFSEGVVIDANSGAIGFQAEFLDRYGINSSNLLDIGDVVDGSGNPLFTDPFPAGDRVSTDIASGFDVPGFAAAARVLGVLGVAGDLVGGYITYANASELAAQGDTVGAFREWVGFFGELSGGFAGGTIGGAAGFVLGLGPWGAVGGSLLGGVAGGELGRDALVDLFDVVTDTFGIDTAAEKAIAGSLVFDESEPGDFITTGDILALVDANNTPRIEIWQDAASGVTLISINDENGNFAFGLEQDPEGLTTLSHAPSDGLGSADYFFDTSGEVLGFVQYDESGAPVADGQVTSDASGWKVVTERELDGAANPTSWKTTVISENARIGAQNIGALFGVTLGRAIGGDDVFARVAAGSLLSAVLSNVGDAIYLGAQGVDNALDSAFDSFDADLGAAFRSQAVGAISAFLTGELADALDIGEELFAANDNRPPAARRGQAA